MHSKPIPPELLERILSDDFQQRLFWPKIDIRGPDECWPWKASTVQGYGQMGVRITGKQFHVQSHVVAWMSKNKRDVPIGMWILHSCIASRSCCNPSHLRIGTPLENIQDMDRQGRRRDGKGEAGVNVKLTNEKVWAIRKKYSEGNSTQDQLALEFGVGHTRIWEIVHRKAWTHI